MKFDSIWFGNFRSIEDVYMYTSSISDEYQENFSQFQQDYKIKAYEDESIFQVYYQDATDNIFELLSGNPGDYQYIEQLKGQELLTNYNTVIIYSGYDYKAERDETGLKYVVHKSGVNYNIDYIGTFIFDYQDAREKYPRTLSKYGDEPQNCSSII